MRFILGIILLATTFIPSQRAEAPIPPEAYSLVELKPGEPVLDPEFLKWEQSVNGLVEPEDMSGSEYATFAQNLSIPQKLLTDLKRLGLKKKSERKAFIANIETNLAKEEYRQQLREFLLYPDLINELLETKLISKDLQASLEEEIRSSEGNTCPKKESILRQLEGDKRQLLPEDDLKDYLAEISRYRSNNFKRLALREVMDMVDEEAHQSMKKELIAAISPHSRLVNDHGWLFKSEETQTKEHLKEPYLTLSKVDESTQRRRCSTAKKQLLSAIKKDESKAALAEVEARVTKVESCFRRRGSRARTRFLSSMEVPLKSAYGFAGEEIPLRRKALIYWSRDKFKDTRKILAYLIKESEENGHKDILSRSLYTSARVDENEGKLAKAIESYKSFVERFPEDEKINEAKTSLILLYTITAKHKEALAYAEDLIKSETLESIDARDTSTLSLALFWGGKLSLQLGDRIKSVEYWRRLASEFYSTFYGAVGHYMLENMLGKQLVLQPSRVPSFDKEAILSVYDSSGRKTISRIEAMLALGLKGEASCETKELDGSIDEPAKVLAKAMYLYASGDWLASIKKFVTLPRTFRHALPRGMERLLFPKAFADYVQQYAQRLKVDPDYVFAIIRQESVFNPRARSPVGASGLMQLMPATARLEARSLRRGYVDGQHRKSLIRKARRKRIFEAETNLALGIHHVYRLFRKYKNPIHVLTSYNANPRATERWMENIDATDALAYVERIPYRETRAYVKLVMRNYFYYKRWYREPGEPSPFMDFLAPKSIELARNGQTKGEQRPQ